MKIIEKTKLQQHKLKPSIVEQECEMMRECAGRESFVQLFDYVDQILSNGSLVGQAKC